MATLTELVETIAEVEDMDPATVGLMARYIREDGLITMRGRGPSAAKMSLTDAANLLIGVNATSSAANVARSVRTYRKLHASQFLSASDEHPVLMLGTLGEAIEQLLYGAGRGELPEPFLGQELDWDFQEAFSRGDVHVELGFQRPRPAARLAMLNRAEFDLPRREVNEPSVLEQWITLTTAQVKMAFLPPVPRGPPSAKKKRTGDRNEETAIGYPTLRAVGKLIG